MTFRAYTSMDLHVFSVYLSSLPVAHLSDALRSCYGGQRKGTIESSAWFFNVLGVQHRHTGPRFNVSSERQPMILVGQPGIRTHNPKHCVRESYALPTELYLLVVDYFRLFIVATGCPSERRPQRTVRCYGG